MKTEADARHVRKVAAVLSLCLTLITAGCDSHTPGDVETLRLATTTSTYETGFLDRVIPPFEERVSVKVHIISVGTGKAIKLAENGDVDLILVHARRAEDKFVEEGYGVNRRDVMHNDFVILGPEDDPTGVAGTSDAKEAFRKIQESGSIFVSRGDESGTHKKEKALWSAAGIEPGGEWYLEAGQGMSATLRLADEKNGYVLVDRGTYLFHKDKIRLKLVTEGDEDLFNPYGIIATNPFRHEHAKYELAMALIGWMTSPRCQEMIGEFKVAGQRLFVPGADRSTLKQDSGSSP